MSHATPVTTEVLENMTLLAAIASRACSLGVSPLQVSINLCKIQKLAVSLKKKDDPFADGYWIIEKCQDLAYELGGSFTVEDAGGNPPELVCALRFGGTEYPVW